MKINWPDGDGIAATVGKNIRRMRIERHMTQNDLAKAVDLRSAVTAVSRWERGENLPRPCNMRKLAIALGCDVRDLTKGE